MKKEKGYNEIEEEKKIGFYGLWKGINKRIIMIGKLKDEKWLIYDEVKV